MITLALDASTYAGDVAVLRGTELLAEAATAMKGAHEERLMPAVQQTLQHAGIEVDEIERIVCGAGPGSFTSLRIAGAIAKGVAAGTGRPLHAVPSMALLVGGALVGAGRYLAAIDALRGEAYVGLYDVAADGTIAEAEPARLVAMESISALAAEHGAKIVSPMAAIADVVASPKARAVAFLDTLLDARGPVDLASWEPAYGRLAEAQVKWESAHGRPLPTG
jgi:tRNA threonylcarbamoyladenosine biosynthesis protein TsaB